MGITRKLDDYLDMNLKKILLIYLFYFYYIIIVVYVIFCLVLYNLEI